MKPKLILIALLAIASSAFTAFAGCFNVSGVVSCPAGCSSCGILVYVYGVGSTLTSGNGAYFLELPGPGNYTICVDPTSLPPGASIQGNTCTKFSVDIYNPYADIDFTLKGTFCGKTPPPPGACWLTGGGTIGTGKGVPTFSFGGVVNPGCSPVAAGGGNWNVVDHARGLHFQGIDIAVLACSGPPTKSPSVNVNTIDYAGTGTLEGVEGNPMSKINVCFIARGVDISEPGAGKDMLYLDVVDCTTGATLMLISTDPGNPSDVAPVVITTGNLQIHTSSCQ